MNPGPAPTMVNDWINGTLFGIIFWVAILAGVVFVIKEIRQEIRESRGVLSPERLDALQDDHVQGQVNRYYCAGHGCRLVVTSSDSRGTRWSCKNCGAQSWVPAASPYDQETDPDTDLGQWEKEMPA